MSSKMFTASIVILMFTSSCSVFEKAVYRPNINQGNYLKKAEVDKIYIGMTKKQVAYILGTSMLKDPFGSNTWFYIFRRELNREPITQQTLTLTFNKSDILTHIDNQSTLSHSSISQ